MNTDDLKNLLIEVETDLFKKQVCRVSNSIGYHIFIRAGNDIVDPETGELRKEWTIWVGNSVWRISKQGNIVASAEDEGSFITTALENLLNRLIISFSFTSQFLDLEIHFEGGYVLETFFCWKLETQWIIFTPNHESIETDFSTQDKINRAVDISSDFVSLKKYNVRSTEFENSKVLDVYFNEYDELTLQLENHQSICLENSFWRIEKNRGYIAGSNDFCSSKETIIDVRQIIGERVLSVEYSEVFPDTLITLSNEFKLRSFVTASNYTEEC